MAQVLAHGRRAHKRAPPAPPTLNKTFTLHDSTRPRVKPEDLGRRPGNATLLGGELGPDLLRTEMRKTTVTAAATASGVRCGQQAAARLFFSHRSGARLAAPLAISPVRTGVSDCFAAFV
ncbi:MAG: hypothetical protein WBX25_21090 [Rhodomicrobium sp.]